MSMVYADLMNKAVPANYNPIPTVANIILGSFGDTFPQETLYAGLIIANVWTASVPATAGSTYVTGSEYGSTNRHIYVCINSGFTDSTEPTWNTSPGGITYENGPGSDGNLVLWQEVSPQFNSGNFANTEPVDASYYRASFDNSQTSLYYNDPNDPNPVVTWPSSASVWGTAAGIFINSASVASLGGTTYAWGLLAGNSIPPSSIPASGFTGTLPLPNQQVVSSGTTVTSTGASVTGVVGAASVGYFSTTSVSSLTVSRSGVTAGNLLMLAVVFAPQAHNTTQSVVTVTGGGANWNRVNYIGGTTTPHIEWWSGEGGTGGTASVTAQLNGTYFAGMTLFEMIGSGTPSAGTGQTGGATAIQFPIQPVTAGRSCVLISSISNGGAESGTPAGGWTLVNGPYLAGWFPIAALVYQVTSSSTAASHWNTQGGGSYPWSTLGVVVAPNVG